ncbi:uncharacterized protein LOC115737153 [Rhodamnia argentea]|uniref:Uncharacterized protein LOC115737153 n=1 Tax=Rhodamnia argentea TaxID=178133 RepID=A0A8B8NR66_9MYRT|nr:uncharacterized protein LOC115737153 [Rhodamnia argentea]XP_030525008.1 uncharacterized protein LOC115737153 [Rhodamnia argentea]XP_048134878.1 uncharacterized protein LOC115737153 [Rhodamnia argentea]XP_048134879.1 uncharacterized protein LOC115737153 [Rhodamnia argentea]
MSKHAEQSFYQSKETTEQSLHSYESVWLAHWARTRHKSVPLTRNRLSTNQESVENDSEGKRNWLVSTPDSLCELAGKQFCEVAASGSVRRQNENLVMISENFMKERSPQPFVLSGLSPNGDASLTLKNDEAADFFAESLRPHVGTNASPLCLDRKERTSSWAPPEAETQSRECHLQFRDSSYNSGMPVKSQSFLEKKKLVLSSSFHDNHVSSSSQGIPDGQEAGGTPIVTSLDRQKNSTTLSTSLMAKGHFRNIQFSQLQHDHRDYHPCSAVCIDQKKDESTLHSHMSETAICDGAPLLKDNSTSKNPTTVLVGKKYQKIQDRFTNKLFPCQSSPPEGSKPEKLLQEYSSRPRHSLLDLETMKICASADSAEGFSSFQPKISQTTHHLFFGKKFGVNSSEGGQIIRESTVAAKYNGHAFGELLSLSPNDFRSQRGVKLQPLWSSTTDSEEKEDAADGRASAIAIKNESSAETDTMDMDAFRENHLSGDASSPVNKDIVMPQKLSLSLAAATSEGEVGGKAVNGDLPEAKAPKRKYLELTSMSSSIDEREPSTSKTQSLDVEHLFSHADQATDSKSQTYFCSHGKTEQRTGWLKRLKMSTSETLPHGDESLKVGDACSSGKDNNLVGKVMKQRTTSPEQIIGNCLDKEQMALGQFALLAKGGKSSSSGSVGKSRDALLSHPWIQRWCHNQVASLQKKPEAFVLCEPRSTKASLDEFRKKQFPSIAAMALMGKAMNGFNPCEFRNRGTYVVWNTEGL